MRRRKTIVGYTDTSSSVAYNLRLSERRAWLRPTPLVAPRCSTQDGLDVGWKGEDRSGRPDPRRRTRALESSSGDHVAF